MSGRRQYIKIQNTLDFYESTSAILYYTSTKKKIHQIRKFFEKFWVVLCLKMWEDQKSDKYVSENAAVNGWNCGQNIELLIWIGSRY